MKDAEGFNLQAVEQVCHRKILSQIFPVIPRRYLDCLLGSGQQFARLMSEREPTYWKDLHFKTHWLEAWLHLWAVTLTGAPPEVAAPVRLSAGSMARTTSLRLSLNPCFAPEATLLHTSYRVQNISLWPC